MQSTNAPHGKGRGHNVLVPVVDDNTMILLGFFFVFFNTVRTRAHLFSKFVFLYSSTDETYRFRITMMWN